MKYLIKKYQEQNNLKWVIISISAVYLFSFIFLCHHFKETIDNALNGIYAIDRTSGIVVNLKKEAYTLKDREIEYKNHLRLFINCFYGFDRHTFLNHMEEAKNYMNYDSFQIELDKYRKDKILERISEDDLILSVKIDQIDINIKGNSSNGTFSFVQSFRKAEQIRKRIFEGTFSITDSDGRTIKNPHACSIQTYMITRKEIIND